MSGCTWGDEWHQISADLGRIRSLGCKVAWCQVVNGTINDETSEKFTQIYTVSASLCWTVFSDGSSRQLFLLDDDLQDRIKSVPYMLTTTTTTTVIQKLPIQDILDRLDVTVEHRKGRQRACEWDKIRGRWGAVSYRLGCDWDLAVGWFKLQAFLDWRQWSSVLRERERERKS